jgi:hypothetical protein
MKQGDYVYAHRCGGLEFSFDDRLKQCHVDVLHIIGSVTTDSTSANVYVTNCGFQARRRNPSYLLQTYAKHERPKGVPLCPRCFPSSRALTAEDELSSSVENTL